MINIGTEELLTLNAAAKRLPKGRTGKPVHVSTLHRWASAGGLSGVRLETVKVGGVRYTSVEALSRFVERCTAGDSTTLSLTSRSRKREIEQAEHELSEAGI